MSLTTPEGGSPLRTVLSEPVFVRLWSVGTAMSVVRWLEMLAMAVFTYEATGSAFVVTLMTLLRILPMALFGVPFGALAARVSRRDTVLFVLAVLLLTSLVLIGLAVAGTLQVWHLAIAAFLGGTAWTTDNPFRRGLIGDAVGVRHMGTAMALDSMASNASRLLGPGLAGIALSLAGIEAVFALAAVLYGVALVLAWPLARDRPEVVDSRLPQPRLRTVLAAGFVAARASPALAGVLWITIVFNVFAWPILSLVPVLGTNRYGMDPFGVGLLTSMDGVGTLAGGLLLALRSPANQGMVFAGGVIGFLLLAILLAFVDSPVGAALTLVAIGFVQSGFSVMQATLVYRFAPEKMRMQAMGLLTMAIGVGPVGFLLLGALAEWLGAPTAIAALAAMGLLVAAISVRWWLPVWRDRGLAA